MKWHAEENKRMMPWKGERNPYKVWLSEIILQQTRVEQGWKYYENFVAAYPAIKNLANAKDEDVFKLWEGLGYYTRCKNLLHTARNISENFNNKFPEEYNTILSLKGIGAYTASAIASFCFDLPHAVVDGNVLRILSRYFGIDIPVDSTEGKKFFAKLAQECLDEKNAASYNQSIMDFGATVCKPVPLCKVCLLHKTCVAFNQHTINTLPVKGKKISKKTRWFTYFIFSFNQKKYVQLRTAKDIWQNLNEFYLKETTADPAWNTESIQYFLAEHLSIKTFKNTAVVKAQRQTLTHQYINGYFITVELTAKPKNSNFKNGMWLTDTEIKTKAFPRFLHRFLNEKFLQTQFL